MSALPPAKLEELKGLSGEALADYVMDHDMGDVWEQLEEVINLTNEQVGELVLNRLNDFAPAVAVKDGETPDQVEVSVLMSRTPLRVE